MELKKAYKQTELGLIPTDWEVKELGEIGKFKNGINKSNEDFGFGFPFVNLMDVFGKTSIRENESLNLINSNEAERKLYNLKKGDVLFIRSSVKPSGVGLTCVIEHDLLDVVFSGFIIRFRGNDFLNTEFKKHCFYSERFRNNLIASSTVSANTNINQEALKKLKISFPLNLSEQTAIAIALSDMDELIAQTEKLIEKKKAIKQGVMQELLRPKEGWVTKKLGEVCEIYQPKTISQNQFTDDGYIVYGANGIVGFYNAYNHETWQVMITCRGSTCGTVNKSREKSWITGNAMVMNVDSNSSINKSFFYYLLSKQDFSKTITGSGQPQIVREPLFNFEVTYPLDINYQKEIAEVIDNLDNLISKYSDKLQKLKNQKQGMMQALLTGKIRLV